MKKSLGLSTCFLIGLAYGIGFGLLTKLLFDSIISYLVSAGIAGALSLITIEELEEGLNK